MKIKKEELHKSIMNRFAILEVQIQSYNNAGYYDIDIAMEDLICDVLNLTYGYELDNLNKQQMNFPGIDLGDEQNRIAVQVTAESNRKKIEKTIETFEEKGHQSRYDRLIIMILGKRGNYKKGFQTKTFCFCPEKDILDLRQLQKDILKCNTSQMERINRLLRTEAIYDDGNDGYKETKTMYARAHTNNIQMKAERLYEKMRILREKYPLNRKQFREAAYALDKIRRNRESVYSFEEEMEICQKAFLFVKELTRDELCSFNDLGAYIHISVLIGLAQRELEWFFRRYIAGKTEQKVRNDIENDFSYLEYTYEQMQRILQCCENVMAFDPNSVHFSTGYISERVPTENLLAASLEPKKKGEQNKIYVWDRKNMGTPAAVLGGIYEKVWDTKLFRINDSVLVTARGRYRIYIWNLQEGSCEPVSILESEGGVSGYELYFSKNGNWYVMGRNGKRIFLWELYGDEKPVYTTELKIDSSALLVVNTRLKRKSYRILGEYIYDSFKNYEISWLIEKSELEFETELICDKEQIVSGYCGSEEPGFNKGEAQVASDLPVLGIRTTNTLFLYDMCKKQNLAVIPQEGQEISHYEIITQNGEIYLMVYYLYISYRDDGKGLIRYFSIHDGCATEIGQWFRGKLDIQIAVTGSLHGAEEIYFNPCLDYKIYGVGIGDADARQVCSFLESMYLVDMALI